MGPLLNFSQLLVVSGKVVLYPLSSLSLSLRVSVFSFRMPDLMVSSWGIQLSPSLTLSHLLFVDDVILLGSGTLQDWSAFEDIIETFCKASGMRINIEKLCFLYYNLTNDCLNDFAGALPYRMFPLQSGFNYLGYHLKPLGIE